MKKVLAIFFTVFYTLTTVGVTVNMHYCGGELRSLAIVLDAESCCEDDVQCDCCKDETIVVQNEIDELFSQIIGFNIQSPVFFVESQQTTLKDKKEVETALFHSFADTSPPLEIPIYLSNCSLTYYG